MNQLKVGAILSYVIIAVNNVIGLLYTPYLLRMLGQNEYGLYSLVSSVVAYLTILDFGFNSAIIRYTAKYRAEGKYEKQYRLFGMFFILYGCIALLTVLIGVYLLCNVDGLFSKTMTPVELHKIQIMLGILIFNVAFTFPMNVWSGIVIAYERFVFQRLVNLFRVIANPLVMILLLNWGYKAVAMVVVLTVFNVITLCLNAWYCIFKLRVKVIFGKFDKLLVKEIFSFSFWIFLGIIVDRVYWSAGQFLLGIYVGTVAVAVYSVAIQVQSFYSSFSYAISGVFLPKVIKIVTVEKSMENVSRLFVKVGRIQYHLMLFIFCGFVLFGRYFLQIWAGKQYNGAYEMTICFLFPILFTSIQTLGYSILQAKNQLKFRAILLLFSSLMALVISMFVIPVYGGIGCAFIFGLAIFLGQVLVLNIYYYYSVKLDIINFWSNILRMSVVPILLVIVYCAFLHFYPIHNNVHFLLHIFMFASAYIGVACKFNVNHSEYNIMILPIIQKLKLWREKYL